MFSLFLIQKDRFHFYKHQFFLNILLSFFGVYIKVSILQIFAGDDIAVLIYVLIANTITTALTTGRIPDFCKAIKKGEIIRYYIRPLSLFHHVLIEEIGNSLYQLFQMLPLLLFACFLQKPDLYQILWLILAILLSLILAALLAVCIFALSLPLANFAATKALLTCITAFFSGGMIPLMMLPDFFQKIAYVTPFAFLVDGVVQVFHHQHVFWIIGAQICWIMMFYLIGSIVFAYCEKKLHVFGG